MEKVKANTWQEEVQDSDYRKIILGLVLIAISALLAFKKVTILNDRIQHKEALNVGLIYQDSEIYTHDKI